MKFLKLTVFFSIAVFPVISLSLPAELYVESGSGEIDDDIDATTHSLTKQSTQYEVQDIKEDINDQDTNNNGVTTSYTEKISAADDRNEFSTGALIGLIVAVSIFVLALMLLIVVLIIAKRQGKLCFASEGKLDIASKSTREPYFKPDYCEKSGTYLGYDISSSKSALDNPSYTE